MVTGTHAGAAMSESDVSYISKVAVIANFEEANVFRDFPRAALAELHPGKSNE